MFARTKEKREKKDKKKNRNKDITNQSLTNNNALNHYLKTHYCHDLISYALEIYVTRNYNNCLNGKRKKNALGLNFINLLMMYAQRVLDNR